MKPFSKMEAIGNGKPVVTRDGKKVTQLKEFEIVDPYHIAGVMEGSKCITTWTDDGKYNMSAESEMDLFMASTKHEGWVAFGPRHAQTRVGAVAFTTHAWPTKEEAVRAFRSANDQAEPVGTQYISWED